jgi:hypothetical protein
VRPTYYDLVAGEGVLPRDVDWRVALATGLKPESVLQTV